MNIFFLDKDPRLAAEYQCDKHVVKMILETAQLLFSAHNICDNTGLVQSIKIQNHPCSKWVSSGCDQYRWVFDHFCFLLQEYYYRYNKIHSWDTYREFLINTPGGIDWDASWTDPPLCMPEECKVICGTGPDTVWSYRTYYIQKKKDFATWKRREIPDWFTKGLEHYANLQLQK